MSRSVLDEPGDLDEIGLDRLAKEAEEAMEKMNRLRERAELAAQMHKAWALFLRYYFPTLARFLKRFERERLIGRTTTD